MTGEKKAAATRYHRKALMTAADRLLVEYGYDGMNMNMLAKEADYSKATVYVYFRSKDELVCALAIERLKLMRREIALVLKNDFDINGKLDEVGNILTEFANEDSVYFDYVTARAFEDGEAPTGTDELRALVKGIFTDLTVLTDADDLLGMWYTFYGKIKTKRMARAVMEEA
ncbi:MAG: TetR/AcrR family transcriptional regulator [Clostridiales bacterium]|nr:TetR/AcrR family transcriptional regulator [Clostridiales bacterium]